MDLSKIFKILLTTFMLILAINSTAIADESFETLTADIKYTNLIKSFVIRSKVGRTSFYQNALNDIEQPILRILTLVYIYSEMKSHHPLSKELQNAFPIEGENEVISEIKRNFSKVQRSARNNFSAFEQVNFESLKMIFVATETLTEFAPYLKIRDKVLRDTLVTGFRESVTFLADGFETEKQLVNPRKPYLKPAYIGIQKMNKALTPPNIFDKVLSKFRASESPVVSQNGTAPSCSGFFH